VLLIWNKEVWAIKYWQYVFGIGTGMAILLPAGIDTGIGNAF